MRIIVALACLIAITAAFAEAEEKPFYLTIDTPPAPELSPAQALESFSIAPGFEVELVAAEPLIEDPVAITWDAQGRLYAVEMRGYMPDAFGNNEKDPVGYVVRLTDTDDDGRFDSREILLDKLVLPRALAIVNEGLLVGEPPNLWLCPRVGGPVSDVDCAAKQSLGSYGDQPGSAEHAENGLMIGLDNWLYSAKSKRRLQLKGGELVVEPTLFRGQWGITQDNAGRLFYNTNSNLLLGDAFDAQQVVAAGNSSAPGLGERVSTNDQLFAVRVNTGVNRAYVPGVLRKDGRLNRPTSASGMAVYRGDQFPAEQRQDVFVAEPAANAIAHLRLSYDGLTMHTEHKLYPNERWNQIEFFASTDERFRPVDVEVGPDGALYIVDMYRGIIQDHVFMSDQLRAQVLDRQLDRPKGMGRIWRVRATSDEPLRKLPDLSSASSESLITLLGHENAWQRETAQRLLLVRTDRGLDRQLRKAVRSTSALQAVHALWTLSGRSALDRRTVRRALARPESAVQVSALRAGHVVLDRADLLAAMQGATAATVIQQAVLNLAPHNTHPAVQAQLITLLADKAEDRYLPSAIKAAAYQQEFELLNALHQQKLWSAALESRTGFVQALVTQGFRAAPSSAYAFLDFVETRSTTDRWLQIAVLDGLHDVSRAEGFERAALAKPHTLFSTADEALWPAMARARRSVTWPGDDLAADAKPLSPAQQAGKDHGKDYYLTRCANCHGEDGKGIASLAPPLADSPWVTGSSERLARILLQGLQGPLEVAGETWNGAMPGQDGLPEFNDEVASGLMTYLHRAWGHTGRAIDPEFVASIRKDTAQRAGMWTAPELMTLNTNTHYQRYVGRYGGPDLGLSFVYNGQQLEVRSGIFNGPLVALREDQFMFEPRQLKFEFVLDDQGQVVGLRMPTGDGEVQIPRFEG
ncbi:MAG: c-type cytochrome [Pseudomonadales bacterium]